ncbi:J domain-containing protein [Aurantiacibacter odishensis]|uniref:J domain-containing protein n=1 Tax=Aurantiacibacter odishensis TaxID=1155476 RepID=UPI000E712D81|nr:J domain-containing protein [Aurantiacibacter odishensis]
MANTEDFVDYYDLLQVNPGCDQRILEVAFHYFAKMYHPDNAETADMSRFHQVSEAYNVLRNPAKRAEYDLLHAEVTDRAHPPQTGIHGIDEATAQADAEIHSQILNMLYQRRREFPMDAGIVGWLIQEQLGCSDDTFEFHGWYLKSKGFVKINEQGKYAITVEGVDQVMATSRTRSVEQRLIPRTPTDG